MATTDLSFCQAALGKNAEAADSDPVWPAESLQALLDAGVYGWSIDTAQGGLARDAGALLDGYEQLASACLTTCFILSQRESAVRHLKNLPEQTLRQKLLTALAKGETVATVGLSQLTTSRQHQQPVLVAQERPDTILLDGTIPWVTGAAQADHIVIGAVTDTNLQILAVLPTNLSGIEVGPPLDLLALRGSLTAEVRLDHVELPRHWLIAGPAAKVIGAGKGGAGGLETSCLALGCAGAAIAYLLREAELRADLRASANNMDAERQSVRQEMHRLAREGSSPDNAAHLRTQANSLVLRATQVAMTAAKGAGYVRGHPAARWARQALFFLVWSCPRPTMQATLAQLAPALGGECS